MSFHICLIISSYTERPNTGRAYELAFESDSDEEYVVRRPRWIRERVDDFNNLDDIDFLIRYRLSKRTALPLRMSWNLHQTKPQSLMCVSGCDCTCHSQVVTVQPTTNGVGPSISQTGRRKGCPTCQGQFIAAESNKSVNNDLMTTDIPHNPPDNMSLCCYSTADNDSTCCPSSDGCGDNGCYGESDGYDCGD